MTSWIATIALGLLVLRIIWVEVRFGRVANARLENTRVQIDDLAQTATRRYREKFGKDPTNQYPLVDPPEAATKRP